MIYFFVIQDFFKKKAVPRRRRLCNYAATDMDLSSAIFSVNTQSA